MVWYRLLLHDCTSHTCWRQCRRSGVGLLGRGIAGKCHIPDQRYREVDACHIWWRVKGREEERKEGGRKGGGEGGRDGRGGREGGRNREGEREGG